MLKLEAEEAIGKLTGALKTIEKCVDHFRQIKSSINDAASTDASIKPWQFDDELVFERLYSYRERIKLLHSFSLAVLDFLKLEKVEVGVERWNIQIKSMYEHFCSRRDEIAKQSEEKFDILDPHNPGFVHVYHQFNALILDYDRRLAAIASLAFANAGNLEAACKMILSFQGLLDRSTIAEEFIQNYHTLLAGFDTELTVVKQIFDSEKSNTNLAKNMPGTAGVLLVSPFKICFYLDQQNSFIHIQFLRELRERLQRPRALFDVLQHRIFASAEALRIFAKYEELLRLLSAYEAERYHVSS